ncbi:MAG TPA: LysR substrate-binding domain-containing protein [Xanthomonadales bacterium]|nr:LysR substrate-binding domain-containing protein [Xanthomonadales bacterium]
MRIHLDISLLRNFAVIAEVGVMSRAAEQVGRTQAALSQQIKKLEAELEQTLMIRSAHGVTLTIHGERLLTHAYRIIRAHDEALAELSGDTLSGSISLGCPDDYARVFLPPLLREFARLHPQVLVEVICGSTPRLLEKLDEHALDIAIVSQPESLDPKDVLRREPLVWVGMKGSDAFNMNPLRLALSDVDTLDYNAATSTLKKANRDFRIAYASGSIAGLTAVVRSGQAITVLTQTAVPPDLEIIPASSGLPELPSVDITVVSSGRISSRLLNSFEKHIRTLLPTL